jgi:hypothetical protein
MKRILVLALVCLAVVSCKKEDESPDPNNSNPNNSNFDKPCLVFGQEYYDNTVTYTWDNGAGTTTVTEDCAYQTGMTDYSVLYGKTSTLQWDYLHLTFAIPEDSSTLSKLEISTTNQPFGTPSISSPAEFDNYFQMKLDDNMGVEWNFPKLYSSNLISGSYYHRFTSLDQLRDDNEIVWNIQGEFNTFVTNSNDSTQTRVVSGNYSVYVNTNRL